MTGRRTCTRTIRWLRLSMVLLLTAVLVRCAVLQLLDGGSLVARQRQQFHKVEVLPAVRGRILDRHGRELAIMLPVNSLFAEPHRVENPQAVAAVVADATGRPAGPMYSRLTRERQFIWLARGLAPEAADRVRARGLHGLGFRRELYRFYPAGQLASHLLGLTDVDSHGLEGLELAYDRVLEGEPGWRLLQRDGRQRPLLNPDAPLRAPQRGDDLILTIDEVIQHLAEAALERTAERYHASSGSVVVLDPTTGELLALANYPTFDPNDHTTARAEATRNRAITDLMEPGSIFKIVAASALLEERLISLDDSIFCENGAWRLPVGRHILHDHTPHGTLTFGKVIVKSSNIGTSKAAQRLTPAQLYAYIQAFGFGQPTRVDLPGEIGGVLRPVGQWSKLSPFILPIGHEVGVTALQMACAMAVIANGGTRMRPYVVREIRDAHGQTIQAFNPQPHRQVLSPGVARQMRELLALVVEEGTGKRAKLTPYRAGGKTGTAQKLNEDGTYSHQQFVASFVGFAPVDRPRLVIAVHIHDPHPAYLGGTVAAPVFQEIASAALPYLGVAPTAPALTVARAAR